MRFREGLHAALIDAAMPHCGLSSTADRQSVVIYLEARFEFNNINAGKSLSLCWLEAQDTAGPHQGLLSRRGLGSWLGSTTVEVVNNSSLHSNRTRDRESLNHKTFFAVPNNRPIIFKHGVVVWNFRPPPPLTYILSTA